MNFYDLHVHPEIDPKKMIEFAKLLGWDGICFVFKSLREIEKFKKTFESNQGLDIAFGLKIEVKNPEELKKIVRNVRREVELISIFGGDLEINRKACETPEVDILTHPEFERNDSGLDHVTVKLAKENNVSIEFNFRELLFSYKKSRADVFSKMLKNAKLVRKYNAPFIITSGALDPHDLRSPSDLISFGRVLGLDPKKTKLSFSGSILKENRKRLASEWVMPGVEIEHS
jgi:ribonuclease P/MRP protein subunit RPP1